MVWWDWERDSVGKHQLSICKALGSILSTSMPKSQLQGPTSEVQTPWKLTVILKQSEWQKQERPRINEMEGATNSPKFTSNLHTRAMACT